MQRDFGLTRREQEILSAIVAGLRNHEIAHKFSISEHTVKRHLANIFLKCGVHNMIDLRVQHSGEASQTASSFPLR